VTRILRFSLRFLLLYALLQFAFSFTPPRELGSRLVASVAAQTLQLCMARNVDWALRGDEIQISVRFKVEERWKQATSKLGAAWYTRNIPMFVALVLAALKRGRRGILLFLGVGGFAVILLDGIIVASHAWAGMKSSIPYNTAGHVLSVFGVWTLGGFFVAPIFLGAALALAILGDPGRGPKRQVGRNNPCPCGSGRKYKGCCASENHVTI
jgi:hypothetical protein